ncbi:queuosine precursor transporter [Deinococcus sp. MIMF12]|uniref:Probable queuosine precursor transporter n=1 Tax=Deinococcus rhizophilus TaxID=3049544 RepID=A0ABT7JHK9_9DEIO|nr:queuosine precursor transporter [Deinococcus rhizophilus]MDL2344411.1 queuosine precursor transporter [Deinococcus rhizophilus]
MTQRNNLLIILIALYIGAELVSNVTAGRLVQLGALVFPGAIFLYSLTFTLRDAIHTVAGWKGAKALLWGGFAANALLAGYGLLVNALPKPGFFEDQAYQVVFGSTLRVVAASLVAYLISTALDALIFERLKRRGVVVQVIASNAVSTTLDTAVFITLAFAGTGAPLLNLMLGQVLLKMTISLLLIPLVRWVRTKVEAPPTPEARAELA